MAEPPNGDVFPWLKSLPVAPEYRPTLSEFQDPIAYIFKIEKEASKYGICKIIPPFPPPPKKTAISNFTRSLAARSEQGPDSSPTFTTRQQQIGFCPRRPRPVQRPVWQSGEHYTFKEFEAKAKSFEKSYLKKHLRRKGGATGSLSALEAETLFWKATVDKPFKVEYANDMPGSAFSRKCCEDGGGVATLAESAWNMREVSRANGSLLRFMKEEIPGVTSPMVYLAMLFSWFAWHVEDHDLHSLNYLHMGAGKTWYGVPRDAAVAFEEVVRVHGYGGEINPLVTFATLGEKTTVMSPEVLISAGVPCCRLVQNAGEFVVTFPRAYHSGFSHGFNCGEAANIATPEWLRVAKDAAIRRASINYPPMVSHFQLLYDLALALYSRIPEGIVAEPRSSRLKDKKRGEGETVIKEQFVQDVLQNNDLLHVLSKRSAVVLLPRRSFDISFCSKLRIVSQKLKVNPEFSLAACTSDPMNSSKGFVSDDLVFHRNHDVKQEKSFYSVKDKFTSLYERNRINSFDVNSNTCSSSSMPLQSDTEGETGEGVGSSDQRLFSCVTCGILCFSCVAIVQPREPAARSLGSADCSSFNSWVGSSGLSGKKITVSHEDATNPELNIYAGWLEKKTPDGLYDDPVQSARYQLQTAERNYAAFNTDRDKGNTALSLLASAYGNSSDSEEDHDNPDIAVNGHESRLDRGDGFSHQSFDYTFEKQDYETGSGLAFNNIRAMLNSAATCSPDVDVAEKLFVKPVVSIDNKNDSLAPQCDEDSSRMHVFCLEHAVEAEQQLRSIGGAHILLLCHPDYPKLEADAKLVSEDLGIDYMWKNIVYRHATNEDEERIQLALDSEEAISGNGDWAVKLGINLFYSANLSRSSLYSKQMPYNSVIYNAFGYNSPASSSGRPKVYQRRANRQKKVVAGKWCGKVWMANQVHPLLSKRDYEDEDERIEKSESVPKSESNITKLGRKRKMTANSGRRARKGCPAKKDVILDDSTEDKPKEQPRRILRSKQARHNERDGVALDRDYSPPYCHRKSISRQTNCSGSDVVSDDWVDDDYHRQHKRNVHVKEAEFIDNGVVSDDTIDYDSDWQQRGVPISKQVEDIKRDANSEDSSDVGSLQFHRESPISEDVFYNKYHCHKLRRRNQKSRQCKQFAEKDIMTSDDYPEQLVQKQQRRDPKSRQAKSRPGEDAVSDDQLEGHTRKYRKTPKGRLAECTEGEDVISDDRLEDHFLKQRNSIPTRRLNKGIDRVVKDALSDQLGDNSQMQQTILSRRSRNKGTERKNKDAMSDDQFEDHLQKQQRCFPISRQNKCIDRELMDDSAENNSHLLRKTTTRKQAKFTDEDDVNSCDEVEDGSPQQHKKILRSNQSKPKKLKQIKQANLLQVKNQTSRAVKRGAETPVKEKAQKTKQPLHSRNKPSGNSREFSLDTEDEEGGPSTRLRKRAPKVEESEVKPKEKTTKRKKAKNATVVKVEEEEKHYQCDMEGCTMSFGTKQELSIHKRNICPIKGCGKKFFSHKYLVQHRRVHEDDRPLKCPWKGCEMSFKWAWARTEHIRVHTGERPYVCAEPGCGQTFRFVSDFSRHKRKTGHTAKRIRQ